MMKLYDEYADDNGFAMLAIHSKRAQSFDDMDAAIDEREIREKHWDGRHLPFPILLDAEGKTQKIYQVSGFPTELLISPSGKLIYADYHSTIDVLSTILSVDKRRRGGMGEEAVIDLALAQVNRKAGYLKKVKKALEVESHKEEQGDKDSAPNRKEVPKGKSAKAKEPAKSS